MTAARRRILRWGLRVALVAALVALVSVDARMKGGEGAGFVPANATWVAYTPQFTNAWSSMTRTSSFRDIVKQWPAPYNNAQLHVRLATGIRPTPLRWSTWLGKKAVVFGSDKGIGWCVRPGLLLRAAHALNAAVSTGPETGDFTYGPFHYAWRDGFVVFSTSTEVVDAALNGAEFKVGESVEGNEVYVQWSASPKGSLVLRAQEGIPVSGAFDSDSQGGDRELLPWPAEPFMQLSVSDAADFVSAASVLRTTLSTLPEWCRAGQLVPEPSPYLAATGQANALLESGLALYPAGMKEARVPETALRFRFESTAPAPPEATPPIKSVAAGSYWYLASSETLLERLGATEELAPGAKQALEVQIQWGEAGKAFEKHLRAILEDDDSLRESIEGTGVPCAQALGTLGRLQINGHREDGKVRFEGNLAQGVEKSLPQQGRDSVDR